MKSFPIRGSTWSMASRGNRKRRPIRWTTRPSSTLSASHPLEVGQKYTYARYFRKEKNPVTIEVLKRESMDLPDGSKVKCLVLHPVIDTKGLFSKRSDTRIWLTDDARRLPVQIRTKFPFGTITLRLKDMVLPGTAASAMSR